jgi:hypothetical protein
MTSKVLRQWSAPEVILVVTNLADKPTLLFHAVKRAPAKPRPEMRVVL